MTTIIRVPADVRLQDRLADYITEVADRRAAIKEIDTTRVAKARTEGYIAGLQAAAHDIRIMFIVEEVWLSTCFTCDREFDKRTGVELRTKDDKPAFVCERCAPIVRAGISLTL